METHLCPIIFDKDFLVTDLFDFDFDFFIPDFFYSVSFGSLKFFDLVEAIDLIFIFTVSKFDPDRDFSTFCSLRELESYLSPFLYIF